MRVGIRRRLKNWGAKIQAALASLNLEAPDEEARTRQAAKENTRDQDHGGIEPRSSTVVGRQRTRVAKTAGGQVEVHTRVLRFNLMTCGTGCLGERQVSNDYPPPIGPLP